MDRENKISLGWREHYRVRIGFIFGLVFIWSSKPKVLFLVVLGFIVALAGLLLRQWSAGCVKKMDELATSGPYALVRHPLYVGSFLIASGFVLAVSSFEFSLFSLFKPGTGQTLLYWAILWILFDSIYYPKILKEEEDLKMKFLERYEDYSKNVPRFVPKEISWSALDFSTFSPPLWKKNKEYLSILGYLIICAFIAARYGLSS